MGNKKRATCIAILQQNELYSDVARFTTNIKLVLQQIRLLTGLNVGCKTRNITIQLVLQRVAKQVARFFFFFCPFFRAFTEKEKVLVRSKAFSTRSDSGEEGEMAEAGGGKGPQFCSLFICLSVFFTNINRSFFIRCL